MPLTSDRRALGAFCEHVVVEIAGRAGGPLSGFTFAAKDIFAVAGQSACCGNPDWLESHPPADVTAPAVQQLVDAGATLVGMTIPDELAFSLNGQNFHYGTPVNAAAPDRIPGGSSSGSAAAVSGAAVDFALGSDTGGSVRIPAALQGIFGIRPSHGVVDDSGVMPLAPSFDTVGWFARSAEVLRRVGDILLPPQAKRLGRTLLVGRDALALADSDIAAATLQAVDRIAPLFADRREVTVAQNDGGLREWLTRFRRLQPREIWATHGDWIKRQRPGFGPEIAERFALAERVAATPDVDHDTAFRRQVTILMEQMFVIDSGVLAIPTASTIAPLKTAGAAELAEFRDRTLSLTSIAGLARLPQVQIPIGRVRGAPIGLSLIGPAGTDTALLGLAERAASALV
jgi:amidase